MEVIVFDAGSKEAAVETCKSLWWGRFQQQGDLLCVNTHPFRLFTDRRTAMVVPRYAGSAREMWDLIEMERFNPLAMGLRIIRLEDL